MGDVLANLNYDFVYGLFTGIGVSFATWFVYKPDTIEHFVLSSLKPATVPSPSTEPQQLSLPFDAPEAIPSALLPSTPVATNVTMTLAPTILPRPVRLEALTARRGRPRKTATVRKTSSKSTTKSTQRKKKSRSKQSRSTVFQFFRRLTTIK